MDATPHIILFDSQNNVTIFNRLKGVFNVEHIWDMATCIDHAADNDIKAIVIESYKVGFDGLEMCGLLKENDEAKDTPVILMSENDDLQDRLRALELGCDDVVSNSVPDEELQARIFKSIFNKIANEQLTSQLQLANKMAFSAMSNTSDLGINIQFLVNSVRCDNLDELGQLFFQAAKQYNVKCSLQMRSKYEIKNMEENGLAKDLESQLLTQMKDAGRYYDFGKRTVCNFEQVSLLIKNMPEDSPEKYGMIKDNTFAMLQGLDARLKALDMQKDLEEEHDVLKKVTHRMTEVMGGIDDDYQAVMRDIADEVEDMSLKIDGAIMHLGLSEDQEKAIENIMMDCIVNTNKVFNDGLKIDRDFKGLLESLDSMLAGNSQDQNIHDLLNHM